MTRSSLKTVLMSSLVSWLQLVRLPNLATSVADPLAGFLVVGGFGAYENLPMGGWLVIASSLCLYAGGMVQNDVADLEIDQRERPLRPLPSGRVSRGAASLVANLLLALGVILTCVASAYVNNLAPSYLGLTLAAAICCYNRFAKGTRWGALVMGCCRSLNWSLGMVVGGSPLMLLWMIPCGIGVYVGGITLFAHDEVSGGNRKKLFFGAFIMLIGLILAGLSPLLVMKMKQSEFPIWLMQGRLIMWCALWGVLGFYILARCGQAIVNPVPHRMQAAVGNAIMSIITLDAVLVLAFCGEQWAVVVLALLVWFVLGRRIAAVT